MTLSIESRGQTNDYGGPGRTEPPEQKQIEAMRQRAAETNAGIEKSAAEIMEAVRLRGYEAVREYSLQFDKAEPYEISEDTLEAAAKRIEPDFWRP